MSISPVWVSFTKKSGNPAPGHAYVGNVRASTWNECVLKVKYQCCQIFLTTIYQNRGKCTKNFQMSKTYTKWPKNIPNGLKIYQDFPFRGPPKYTQIGIFGLKIYHLATLYVATFWSIGHRPRAFVCLYRENSRPCQNRSDADQLKTCQISQSLLWQIAKKSAYQAAPFFQSSEPKLFPPFCRGSVLYTEQIFQTF
jgi:hypothetical protein